MNALIRRCTFALVLGLLLPAAAGARGELHKGGVTIRYNALPATALPAQSAAQLGIPHRPDQGLLNVMVSTGAGADASGVEADIHARATAENGTPVPVHMREIKDANGVSYLGTFRIRQTGPLRFDLDVTAPGAATRHVQFTHVFVTD